MNKKKAAWLLFKEETAQEEISKIINVHPKTISRWAKNENWEGKRDKLSGIQDSLEEGILELIAYQQRVLILKKTEWEQDILEVEIGNKDAKDLRLIEKGDIDALQKLYSSIKGKPKNWSNYVTIMRDFLTYIQEIDLNLAQKLTQPMQIFLNEKRGEL